MLIIKYNDDKREILKLIKDKKINKEIIDTFLKNYEWELNSFKGKENLKNNIHININDFNTKQTVSKNYNIEFSIIIEDNIKEYFVKKYIEIKVVGDIDYNKFPKFYFYVKQYKLTLDRSKEKNMKDNKNIICRIKPDGKKRKIGFCPDYSINNNEKLKMLYININGKEKVKDPQNEIYACLDNLIMILEINN